jgi:acetyl-CoA acetyltransferase
VFDPEHGVVTAGTSSPLTDGASAVLVTTEEFARSTACNRPRASSRWRQSAAIPR